jgi:aminoglycoside 3'-phosphotransferase-2
MTSRGIPVLLPPAWRERLAGYAATPQAIGESGAAVFRLTAAGRPPLFAKGAPLGTIIPAGDEGIRLRWLSANGIP